MRYAHFQPSLLYTDILSSPEISFLMLLHVATLLDITNYICLNIFICVGCVASNTSSRVSPFLFLDAIFA